MLSEDCPIQAQPAFDFGRRRAQMLKDEAAALDTIHGQAAVPSLAVGYHLGPDKSPSVKVNPRQHGIIDQMICQSWQGCPTLKRIVLDLRTAEEATDFQIAMAIDRREMITNTEYRSPKRKHKRIE